MLHAKRGRHAAEKVSLFLRSFSTRARLAFAGLAGLGLITGVVLTALPSGASDTAQCAAAVTAPYGNAPAQWCSAQELVTLGLGLAAPNKVAEYAQATVKPWTTTNGSEDFAVFRSNPANSQVKTFEYAYRGEMSGLCLAVSNNHTKIVFKNCNPDNTAQQFQPGSTSADGGNSWDSVLTGQAITAPGGAFSRLITANDVGSTHQGFTYEQ